MSDSIRSHTKCLEDENEESGSDKGRLSLSNYVGAVGEWLETKGSGGAETTCVYFTLLKALC